MVYFSSYSLAFQIIKLQSSPTVMKIDEVVALCAIPYNEPK